MTTRGIRRKKSSLSEVKIAVLGASSVGKSALSVRFLTKRYIGEYDHQTETRYKHEAMVDGEPILFEILDTCPAASTSASTTTSTSSSNTNSSAPSTASSSASGGSDCNDRPAAAAAAAVVPRTAAPASSSQFAEAVQWSDGILLVYSITERESFNYVRSALAALQSADVPVQLVGNMVDMVHLRQVSIEEGEILGKDYECRFAEVSAAEQVGPVADAFHDLCREVLQARRKSKQSLLDRMLGGTRAYSRGKSDSALPKD